MRARGFGWALPVVALSLAGCGTTAVTFAAGSTSGPHHIDAGTYLVDWRSDCPPDESVIRLLPPIAEAAGAIDVPSKTGATVVVATNDYTVAVINFNSNALESPCQNDHCVLTLTQKS
jgi:hypothetical protein